MTLGFPPIFLLPTHLAPEELHELEAKIDSLTYDIDEADIIVGNVSKKARALFELRRHCVTYADEPQGQSGQDDEHRDKRTRVHKDVRDSFRSEESGDTRLLSSTGLINDNGRTRLRFVRLAWLRESLSKDHVLPVDDYIVLDGYRLHVHRDKSPKLIPARTRTLTCAETPKRHPAPLLHETTSEHDRGADLSDIPHYLMSQYSCQRRALAKPPNESFIAELKKVRHVRTLLGDRTGIRAYSTSIATLAAYPHQLQSRDEVARLPGCGAKIAELYSEWRRTGHVAEADECGRNPRLAVISTFYDIWGVGDVKAREFYDRGWRNLDDVIEHGWKSHLSRVQQIGVKYYDEFQGSHPAGRGGADCRRRLAARAQD